MYQLQFNKFKTKSKPETTILVDQKIKTAFFFTSWINIPANFWRMLNIFFFLFSILSLHYLFFLQVVLFVCLGFFLILSHSLIFWWFLPDWKLYVCGRGWAWSQIDFNIGWSSRNPGFCWRTPTFQFLQAISLRLVSFPREESFLLLQVCKPVCRHSGPGWVGDLTIPHAAFLSCLQTPDLTTTSGSVRRARVLGTLDGTTGSSNTPTFGYDAQGQLHRLGRG